ncbi:MAG: endo-1,4-beta-xylanase, partial [Acidobacteria bacterium]|nr:endo-1,4-beta-xylanase [Acidobacteriota bacterium]
MDEPTTVREVLETVTDSINDHDGDLTGTYKFVIDGEGTYRLVVTDGHCELLDGDGDEEPVSTLFAAADDALLIFSGRADSMKAFMEGRMRIEGDLMAMTAFQTYMPGGSVAAGGASSGQRVDYVSPDQSPSFELWSDRVAAISSEPQTLREVAAERGLYIGAAVASPSGPSGETLLHREFNGLGAENAFKWHALAKHVGDYDFTATDDFVAYAQQHDMRLRGHTLIWGRAGRPRDLESVVRAASNPSATLRGLMADHIETVVGRYQGKVRVWDVVNEPMAYSGEGFDSNVFFETLGEGYVAESFHLARGADPDAELVLNEQISASQYDDIGGHEFLSFVEKLVAADVPIDGVGVQGHMLMGVADSGALRTFLQRIEQLGLFIEVTEM